MDTHMKEEEQIVVEKVIHIEQDEAPQGETKPNILEAKRDPLPQPPTTQQEVMRDQEKEAATTLQDISSNKVESVHEST